MQLIPKHNREIEIESGKDIYIYRERKRYMAALVPTIVSFVHEYLPTFRANIIHGIEYLMLSVTKEQAYEY